MCISDYFNTNKAEHVRALERFLCRIQREETVIYKGKCNTVSPICETVEKIIREEKQKTAAGETIVSLVPDLTTREILVSHFQQGKKFEDIAADLYLSEGTVYRYLKKGLIAFDAAEASRD